jgi:hypothetical protein
MKYHIEPFENAGERVKIDWLIELEVGDGIAPNLATITDLTKSTITPATNGTYTYRGARTLTLLLDEPPTTETAFQVAGEIALALLVAGRSKPSHLVDVVLHKHLSLATVHQRPFWQSHFRYVCGEPAIPWSVNATVQ